MDASMQIRAIELDQAEVFEAVTAAIGPFVDLVSSLDETEAELPTLDGTWTTTEVAAHVLTLFDPQRIGLAQELGIGGAPRDLDEINQVAIDRLGESTPASLAEGIGPLASKAVALFAGLDPQTPLWFWAGVTATPASIGGVVLGEFLVHGHDIATAVGRPWVIGAEQARTVTLGTAPLIHGWLKRSGTDETITVPLDDGPTLAYDFRAGGLEVGVCEVDGTPGTTIDPVDFMLAFPYRRIGSDHAVVNALLDRFELI